jgi:MoaA/NifB/PqqE/SkfB family radical SAM enzyme
MDSMRDTGTTLQSGYDSVCCFRHGTSGSKRLLWELTNTCNLLCGFCHRHQHPEASWRLENATRVLPVLHDLGVSDIILSGGEPLLLDWLGEFLLILRNAGFNVDLCTNGTLIDGPRASVLSHFLSEISVSLDSASSVSHDQLRGVPGSWTVTVDACRDLIDRGMDVHVISLVSADTVSGMLDMVRLASELGSPSISFIGKMPIGKPNPLVSDKIQGQLRDTLAACRAEFPSVRVNTKRLVRPVSYPLCEAGKSIYGISATGFLLPCILFPTSTAIMSFHGGANVTKPTRRRWSRPRGCLAATMQSPCEGGCLGSAFLQDHRLGCDTLCPHRSVEVCPQRSAEGETDCV